MQKLSDFVVEFYLKFQSGPTDTIDEASGTIVNQIFLDLIYLLNRIPSLSQIVDVIRNGEVLVDCLSRLGEEIGKTLFCPLPMIGK